MSVDLWSWRPSCDDEGCCGDCDLCRKADEVEEDAYEGSEEDGKND